MSWVTETIEGLKKIFGGSGETASEKKYRQDLMQFSSFLPYHAYDSEFELYQNAKSKGFIIEVSPLIGGDERSVRIMRQLLGENFPVGTCVTATCFVSPKVAEKLNDWFVPRMVAGGVHKEMARRRIAYLARGSWDSLGGESPFHIRNFRTFITVEIPGNKITDQVMGAIRSSMMANLKTIGVFAKNLTPEDLISLIDSILVPTQSTYARSFGYDDTRSLNDQVLPRNMLMDVRIDGVDLRTDVFNQQDVNDMLASKRKSQYEYFNVRAFHAMGFPKYWALWDNVDLIGDLFNDQMNLPCPVVTTFAFQYQDPETAKSKATIKFMRVQQQSEQRLSMFTPNAKERASDWGDFKNDLEAGGLPIQMYYGVLIISRYGEQDRNERIVKSIYINKGWDLQKVPGLHVHGLRAALPMTMGGGFFDELKRKALTHLSSSNQAASLLPLQGEYLGSHRSDMLFMGWRGQPFFWSPMENEAGNHNVIVFGKSGSGKSVLLQDLCASWVGSGSHVTVIDDGRSFENSGALQGARNVEFTMSSNFSLNIFKMIDPSMMAADGDYKLECMSLLKAMIGQMCRFSNPLTDTEGGIIDAAVNEVWEAKTVNATVDDIIAELKGMENPLAVDLGTAMQAFGSKGTFGKLFLGQPSFSLSDPFTIFELSDLSGHEELRAVVLTAIMFMSSQKMRRMDRSIPKYLIIDEAWQLLKGGSMAEFVETYARTCRKYGASLVTATQSLADYHKSAGSLAALDNSDWTVMLEQKAETLNEIMKSERLSLSKYLFKFEVCRA
ncbi:MAG: TraC family protein [Sphingomonadales bacterium]|nr:TraC family protein [Sphingomonadales bacterium]